MSHSTHWNPAAVVRTCAALALTISPALSAVPDGTVRSYFAQPGATAKPIRAAALDSFGRVVAVNASTGKGPFRLNLDGTTPSPAWTKARPVRTESPPHPPPSMPTTGSCGSK